MRTLRFMIPMRRIQVLIVIALIASVLTSAQDVQGRLDEALLSYRSEDLENARFSLQEALNEINMAVGKEILSVLPSEMNGMSKIEEGDDVTGMNMGFASLFVHRSYKDETRQASIDLISDSPMLTGVSAMLAMPAFMSSDENQKRVKVSGYKALLTRSESETGQVSYDIQVPLNSSLLSFECEGISNENEVLEMANSIPVDQIVKISE